MRSCMSCNMFISLLAICSLFLTISMGELIIVPAFALRVCSCMINGWQILFLSKSLGI